jgi:hypothetical protein
LAAPADPAAVFVAADCGLAVVVSLAAWDARPGEVNRGIRMRGMNRRSSGMAQS